MLTTSGVAQGFEAHPDGITISQEKTHNVKFIYYNLTIVHRFGTKVGEIY